jgi:hypothetical protein
MDWTLYRSLNDFAYRHGWFEDPLRFFAQDAQYFFVALLAVLFLAGGKWASRNARHGVVAAGFSAALALGIAQVIVHIWERPRPYVAHPDLSHLFISASPLADQALRRALRFSRAWLSLRWCPGTGPSRWAAAWQEAVSARDAAKGSSADWWCARRAALTSGH